MTKANKTEFSIQQLELPEILSNLKEKAGSVNRNLVGVGLSGKSKNSDLTHINANISNISINIPYISIDMTNINTDITDINANITDNQH